MVIVCNPNSTGDGPDNARELERTLAEQAPGLPVQIQGTEYAGHAEEIARQAVSGSDGVLVVSASGDGGYHEVVNGVVSAGRDGHGLGAAAVLASGNANDHAGATQHRPLVHAILEAHAQGMSQRMDLLELQADALPSRVAHSYIGLGISPVAAKALNEHDLDAVRETFLVVRAFWRYRPMTISHHTATGEEKISVDSLIFANINRMAKYAEFSDESSVEDGRYETLMIPHRSKLRLLADVTRILRKEHPVISRSEPYAFRTLQPMPLQLDGEIFAVPGDAEVTVRCLPSTLRTVR